MGKTFFPTKRKNQISCQSKDWPSYIINQQSLLCAIMVDGRLPSDCIREKLCTMAANSFSNGCCLNCWNREWVAWLWKLWCLVLGKGKMKPTSKWTKRSCLKATLYNVQTTCVYVILCLKDLKLKIEARTIIFPCQDVNGPDGISDVKLNVSNSFICVSQRIALNLENTNRPMWYSLCHA